MSCSLVAMASPVEGDNVGWMVTTGGSLMLRGSTSTSTTDGVWCSLAKRKWLGADSTAR